MSEGDRYVSGGQTLEIVSVGPWTQTSVNTAKRTNRVKDVDTQISFDVEQTVQRGLTQEDVNAKYAPANRPAPKVDKTDALLAAVLEQNKILTAMLAKKDNK
jgi:hypothetical protein